MRGRKTDFTGKKFYYLTVIESVGLAKDKHVLWKCSCKCGNETIVASNALVKGTTKSCGCYYESIRGHKYKTKLYEDTRSEVLYRYIAMARKYGREFSLTDEEFFNITQKTCSYCGTSPNYIIRTVSSRKTGRKEFKYNGIDRKDSSKGYTLENCVPCCVVCNRIKSNHSLDFLHQHLQKMLECIGGGLLA